MFQLHTYTIIQTWFLLHFCCVKISAETQHMSSSNGFFAQLAKIPVMLLSEQQ